MALTRLDRVGDGSTTVYNVDYDLGILDKEHVYVYQGDDYTVQLSYVWLNKTQIELDTPVTSGEEFFIRRVVPRDEPINDYTEGAILRERNLDKSFLQSLMILQEIEDGYMPTAPQWVIEVVTVFNQEVQIQEPVNGNNPATKTYVDTQDTLYLEAAKEWVTNFVASYTYEKLVIDSKDAETLATANNYTDTKVQDTYVNDSPVSVLVAARQYGDGSKTIFNTPATGTDRATNFLVALDGVVQRALTDFYIAGSGKVVFIEAPANNSSVDISYFNANLLKLEGTDGVIPSSTPRVLGDGVTLAYSTGTGTQIPEELFNINIDGVTQRGIHDFVTDASGNVVFSEPPALNSVIDIKWFQPNVVDTLAAAQSVLLINKYITQDLVITDPYNGMSVSPTVTEGVQVTVSEGSTYVVL